MPALLFAALRVLLLPHLSLLTTPGGIAGESGVGKILSCYTVVTAMDLTGSGGTHYKGGIGAGQVESSSVIKGCYWQELTGVNSHYGSGTPSDTKQTGT